MKKTIKTEIAFDGQRYVDEPVYVEVSKANPVALAVNWAWAPARGGRPFVVEASITELSHHERVQLRWMKPDGHGGLVPKYGT